MKNFAIFLVISNIVLWGWQLAFPDDELSASKEIPRKSFVQAENKLSMLRDVPPEQGAKSSGQNEGEVPRDLTLSTAEVSVEDALPVQSERALPEPWCGVTNSTSSLERIKSFRAEWLKRADEAEEESVKEPGSSTWWVYLPFKDEGAAQLILKQLHDREIDSYYMRTGELAGGISLGVFSRRDSALSVRDGLKKKGYAAEVKEVPRMENRFRLMLRLRDGDKIQSVTVKEFLGNYRDIQVKEIACK